MSKVLAYVMVMLAALTGTALLTHHPRPAAPRVAGRPAPSAPPPAASPFLSGVVEGFYGNRWTVADTEAVMAFIARQGMNTFVYAPKNDPYQRVEWNRLYPPAALTYLSQVTAAARLDHVNFVYSISPGLSVVYSSPADRAALVAKVNQIRALGVHTFMLSFDDIGPTLDPTDARVYHDNLARAQAALANSLYDAERRVDPAFRLIFTPTDYYGLADNPYWASLKAYLNPQIDVVWTGQWVLTAAVTGAQAAQVRRDLGHPVVFWDNYPVNDWTYVQQHRPRLFMGPLLGRTADLPAQLAGYLLNPMLQARPSEVALYTAAQYLKDPADYRPWAAWQQAVDLLGGPAAPSFRVLCEDARSTFLAGAKSGDPALDHDLRSYMTNPGHPSPSLLNALAQRFQAMAAVNQTLASGLPDHVLYQELAPWATALSEQGAAGLAAVAVLQDRAAGRSDAADLARLQALVTAVRSTSFTLDTTPEVERFLTTVLAGR
jgi:hyaluronoglucosaminidase